MCATAIPYGVAFPHQAMVSKFSQGWIVPAAQTACRERLEICGKRSALVSINRQNAAAIAPD
jgi:hypothetical protein